ncbi:SMC-Scp complex subunit ScpB [Gammaproteobacteria bacterium]|nr:SMC-Scp complex subunit ScpB [Gammaproteobacteria bacterium]
MNISDNLANIVESILFGSGRPMRLSEIKTLLSTQNIEAELPNIKIAMNSLEDRFASSALEIKEVASGYRLQIRNEYGDFLYPLWNDNSNRLSKALMETVSIIAYKQPVTRGDIEDIRGVSVSSQIIRSLLDREWIKAAGYRDVPGRPTLYETTKIFLNDLNLQTLNDLPLLPEALPAEDALDQLEVG